MNDVYDPRSAFKWSSKVLRGPLFTTVTPRVLALATITMTTYKLEVNALVPIQLFRTLNVERVWLYATSRSVPP